MKILDKNKLTELLDYINDYQAKNGKSPSYRTIMKALKFTNLASVFRYVGRLEADGKIKKTNLGGIEISSNLLKKIKLLEFIILWNISNMYNLR